MKLAIFKVFFFISIFINIKSEINIISLGRDCQVAGYLRQFKLRTSAFPFDWIQVLSFESLYKIINDDFKFFLDSRYLISKTYMIHNTYYDILFFHDFPNIGQSPKEDFFENHPIVNNFLDYLPMVKEKYNRRIKRLKEVLNSGEKVILMRSHLLPNDAKKLAKLIEKKYINSNFLLVSLFDKFDGNIAHEFKNIKRVKGIFMASPAEWHQHKWWSPEDWSDAFKSLDIKIN